MMNTFNLTLSGKHFICPSILNDSLAGYSNLGRRSLPFMTLNTYFQPLLACKVSPSHLIEVHTVCHPHMETSSHTPETMHALSTV